MKKIILFLFLLPFISFAQRVKDLSTQTTYDGSAYTIVDKAGWTTSKKMSLNILTGTEATSRKMQDTLTRRGVGLSDGGNYIPDDATYYLTTALMAGYDTNSVMIAMHMLDSIMYKTRTQLVLWDTGAVSTSVKMHYGTNQAVGLYSLASNYYNISAKTASSSFGVQSVANYTGSQSLGGGTYMTDLGANQSVELIARASIKSTSDTLEINATDILLIPTDAVIGFEIYIVGVQTGGGSGTIGNGYYQKFSGVIRNDAGTTVLIGIVDSTTAKRSEVGYPTVAVTADNSLDALDIICTTGANRDFELTAYIRFTYIGFRNFTLGY